MIKEIMNSVSIPVMAKVRIGHTVEAQILQAVGVDYIDVSGWDIFHDQLVRASHGDGMFALGGRSEEAVR
jgi:pyridoxal biosynthesis lyase PdxS